MSTETQKIRALAKRLHDAKDTESDPRLAPHFLNLGDIAYHLTLLADQIDNGPACASTHPDQEARGRASCDTCAVPLW